MYVHFLKRIDMEGDEHGETRWRRLGTIGGTLYVVSHTYREEGEIEIYRFITARRAIFRNARRLTGRFMTGVKVGRP